MRILCACEESQTVCKAFRARGHEAYSCDLQDCSGGHPEWHIKDDVLSHLDDGWDMMIAFPPCTYITAAGAVRLFPDGVLDAVRYEKARQAAQFFYSLYYSDIPMICIENPLPMRIAGLPVYDQIVHPYYFGEPYAKRTCLWLKCLPFLQPTNILDQYTTCMESDWFNLGGSKRQINRSKFWNGIAAAMADQWNW